MKAASGDWKLLALLVVITVAKGLVWMSAFPPFKIADEPSHFENVQYRAENFRAPRFEEGKKPAGPVMHERAAPEVSLLWSATNHYRRKTYLPGTYTVPEEAELERLGKTAEGRDGDGQISSVGYPGFYYSCGVVPYLLFHTHSVLARLMAVRCLSLFFGVLAVLATFLAARLTFDSRALAFAAAWIVVMQPMESQQTIAVNNDAAVIGLSALIYYLQLRMLSDLPSVKPRLAIALAILAGCNVLSKPTGWAMTCGCALIVVFAVLGNLRSRRTWMKVGITSTLFLGLVSTYVWKLYRAGRLLPGDLSAPSRYAPDSFFAFLSDMRDDYKTYLFRSAWGQFGWLDHSLSGDWQLLILKAGLLAKLGLVAVVVMILFSPFEDRRWLNARAFFWSVATAATAIGFVLFAEYRFRILGLVGVIQGRNFLFGLPAFAVVVAACLGAMVPQRYRPITAAAIITGAFALNLGALHTIMWFHYAG